MGGGTPWIDRKGETPMGRLPLRREQDCKPGSVFGSHLSRRPVARPLQPPPRGRPGQPLCPPTVLLRIEFTAPVSLLPAGELLPRLSTLTPPVLFDRRRGGISLLHFSWSRLRRALPAILPCGARTFLMAGRPATRLPVLLAVFILTEFWRFVNAGIHFWQGNSL